MGSMGRKGPRPSRGARATTGGRADGRGAAPGDRPGVREGNRSIVGGPLWIILWSGLVVLSGLLTFDPKLYVNGDNVEYIRLAEAARHGALWASAKYPPLFPWLLTIPQSFFGTALLPQKILVFLIYLGSSWMLMRRARVLFPRGYGEPIAWTALTLIPVLEFGHYVMSEIPYLLLSLLALAAFDRIRSEGGDAPGARRLRMVLWCALAAAATFYTRSVGLSVWAALGLGLLLRRDVSWRERGIFAAASAVLVLPWILRSMLGPPNPYFRQLVQVSPFYPEYGILTAGGWLQRIWDNVRIYLGGEIPTLLTPGIFRWTYDPPTQRYSYLPLYVALDPAPVRRDRSHAFAASQGARRALRRLLSRPEHPLADALDGNPLPRAGSSVPRHLPL